MENNTRTPREKKEMNARGKVRQICSVLRPEDAKQLIKIKPEKIGDYLQEIKGNKARGGVQKMWSATQLDRHGAPLYVVFCSNYDVLYTLVFAAFWSNTEKYAINLKVLRNGAPGGAAVMARQLCKVFLNDTNKRARRAVKAGKYPTFGMVDIRQNVL